MTIFKADGDGWFDIQFDFPPPPGSFAAKFTAGESVIYDITSSEAIDVFSFDFSSAPGGGNGTFRSAAHVQGIGRDGDDSGWIGDENVIPEPASVLVWGLLATAFAVAAWRRRK